jgi:HAD superfamily hydrolase (TIGR01549 family)
MKKIRAILFDLIGTTVLEKDARTVSTCFERSFLQHGVDVDSAQIQKVRGLDKLGAIELILERNNKPLALKSQILESFKNNVQNNISNFEEHPQLDGVIRYLREKQIIIGVGSGLPGILFQLLLEKFNWQKYSFDYVNVYENFKEGRPNPAMIYDMCQRVNIDAKNVLKVGDTVADVEEGKNAGCFTAAVLAGTQPESLLRQANPDFILEDLGDVIRVLV